MLILIIGKHTGYIYTDKGRNSESHNKGDVVFSVQIKTRHIGILVRFEQVCSRIFHLNDRTHYLAKQLNDIYLLTTNCIVIQNCIVNVIQDFYTFTLTARN